MTRLHQQLTSTKNHKHDRKNNKLSYNIKFEICSLRGVIGLIGKNYDCNLNNNNNNNTTQKV
jgi:hypothetical protein